MKAFVMVLTLLVTLPASGQVFLRVGAGAERPRPAALRDADCAATDPPALFGCGFEARGNFGTRPSFDVGLGRGNVEILLTWRDVSFEGTSNFTGVTGEQPVSADGSSMAGLVVFTHRFGRVFVAAGGGAAHNRLGRVEYAFPGLGENARTITRGGSHTDFAWSASAGFSITDSIDVALRYADLGEVRTSAGAATIIRPNRELMIDVDATRADLRTIGLSVSWRFRP